MGGSSSLFTNKYGEGLSSAATLPQVFMNNLANDMHVPVHLHKYKDVHYHVAEPQQTESARSAILYFHGNCDTVGSSSAELAKILASYFNRAVYTFEFPGYGESANHGSPTPKSTSKAGKTIFEMLSEKYANVDIVAHSIGTAVAIRTIALGVQPNKLVLISPLTTTTKVVTCNIPAFNAFDSVKLLKNIKCPVCVIHGDVDSVIDVTHGQELFDALPDTLSKILHIIPGADHDDIMSETTFDHIRTFLE